MNKKDLQDALNREGFNPRCYDLNGELLPDRHLLSREGQTWSVYYFDERGIIRDKKIFATESEACEYFLTEMRDDPTTKA